MFWRTESTGLVDTEIRACDPDGTVQYSSVVRWYLQ